jgi:hypothetical protein
VVAVHVWIVDDGCVELEGVKLVMCHLDDGAAEGCTVTVMLLLQWAADITNVHVDGRSVGVLWEIGCFWVIPWVPYAGL